MKNQINQNASVSLTSIFASLTPTRENLKRKEKALQLINQWAVAGLVYTRHPSLQQAFMNQFIVATERPCTPGLLEMNHPARSVDYGLHILVLSQVFETDLVDLICLILNPAMTFADIELYVLDLAEKQPLLNAYLCEMGQQSLFTLYCAVFHEVRQNPIVEFKNDIASLRKGLETALIDSTMLLPNFGDCYVSLNTETDLVINDLDSGEHTIDGFYCFKCRNNISFSREQFEVLGINPDKPYSTLILIFTGKPKQTLLNDTMRLYRVIVQEGVSVDDILEHTAEWIMSEHCARYPGELNTIGYVKPSPRDDGLAVQDISLIKVAAAYLAYASLNTGNRTAHNERTNLWKQAFEKKGDKRKKTLQQALGTINSITIHGADIQSAGLN